MSELISGKEAWIKAVNGESVQYNLGMQWEDLTGRELNYWQGERFLNKDLNYKFRLKPRTIKLNGIDLPAPFEPKEGEKYWTIDCDGDVGDCDWANDEIDLTRLRFIGVYRTKSEAEQVVAALRSIFNENN